jgi:hypothetical protein
MGAEPKTALGSWGSFRSFWGSCSGAPAAAMFPPLYWGRARLPAVRGGIVRTGRRGLTLTLASSCSVYDRTFGSTTLRMFARFGTGMAM